MSALALFTSKIMGFLATLFIITIGVALLIVLFLFIVDSSQTKDVIRHNYPVVGRFRNIFSKLGEFFRQYFFAMDREEMPFNRAEREWVYKSANGHDNTVAFGSTKSITPAGTVLFVNGPFATLDEEAKEAPALTLGPYCRHPYTTNSLVNISGMSFGAISKPAVTALSRGAKLGNCWLNTGEGGLSPYHLDGGCDLVFQMGTAKYGVRDAEGNLSPEKLRELAAHDQVKMIEIKISQGAKPGKGGILPGSKVTPEIAEIRGINPGEDSISPNRHSEVNDFSSLLTLIDTVREISGKPTGFKTVIGDHDWLEEMCQEIHAKGIESAPDFIAIDSSDGGTGAAPMPLIDSVGLPIKSALPKVVDILVKHGLRDRIKLIASGKLITPAEVAWAYCAGADFVVSARGFMLALGCIQALKCNKNTCPTGITTHDAKLQDALVPDERATMVKNYVKKLRYGTNLIAHSCGVAHPRELQRKHCQIVQHTTFPIPYDELFPPVSTLPEYDRSS